MKEKSKSIPVLKKRNRFNDSERHQIIQEMISTRCTKQEIWKKYTGEDKEHGQIVDWMHKLGYDANLQTRRPNLVENNREMTKKKTIVPSTNDSFEILQLKKRNLELESQLRDAEMKAVAFSTLIDIAEKEFNIPIRKKVNTKPLKK